MKRCAKQDDLPKEEIIYLSPDDIDLFIDDVRVSVNEKYEEMKESIQSTGIDTPIPIAKYPKTGRWMVVAGGNTRLAIAKELELKYVPCRKFAWTNESDALLKHLKENDLRNGYTFYERCLGATKIINNLKNNSSEMLFKQFIEYMSASGYPITSARKLYVACPFVNKVKDIIPKALKAGLGQNTVLELSAVYNKCQREGKQDLFLEQLGEHDSDKFPTKEFLAEIKAVVPISKNTNKSSVASSDIVADEDDFDLDLAREEAYKSALNFSEGCRLYGFVERIPTGIGYLVTNFPRIDNIEEENNRTRISWAWWQLVQLSSIRDASADVLKTYMPEQVEPYVELMRGKFESAYNELDMPFPGTDLDQVYKTFDGETQTSYVSLLNLYWKIVRSVHYDWVWNKDEYDAD